MLNPSTPCGIRWNNNKRIRNMKDASRAINRFDVDAYGRDSRLRLQFLFVSYLVFSIPALFRSSVTSWELDEEKK